MGKYARSHACMWGVCMRMHGPLLVILGKGQVIYYSEGGKEGERGKYVFHGILKTYLIGVSEWDLMGVTATALWG